jgi:hypothetical protein
MQMMQYLEQNQGQGNVYGYLGGGGTGLGSTGYGYLQYPWGGP